MSEPLLVLGAELQAAVSLALSRPDLRFLFVSEQDVVDGWDLDNVEIRRASRESFRPSGSLNNCLLVLQPEMAVVCIERDAFAVCAVTCVLHVLANHYPQWVLPVSTWPTDHEWVLKGDVFHRPDAVLLWLAVTRISSSDEDPL